MASKTAPAEEQPRAKKGGVAGTLLVVLKFILAFCLVPLVIGTVKALLGEIGQLDAGLQRSIYLGTLAYVLMKFFIYDL